MLFQENYRDKTHFDCGYDQVVGFSYMDQENKSLELWRVVHVSS